MWNILDEKKRNRTTGRMGLLFSPGEERRKKKTKDKRRKKIIMRV